MSYAHQTGIIGRIDLMDRREAEQIYESGKEAVVEAFLAMSARLKELEQKFADLEQKIASLVLLCHKVLE